MDDVRHGKVQLLNPDGKPALSPDGRIGFPPEEALFTLAADDRWENATVVEFRLHQPTLKDVPHMGWTLKEFWAAVGGLEVTIDGYEPFRTSMSADTRVKVGDVLLYKPKTINVAAESLSVAT